MSKITVIKKSVTITDMRKACLEMGDSEYQKYKDTDDLAHAAVSLSAYKQAVDAAKVQLTYNKMNGSQQKIKFLEENGNK